MSFREYYGNNKQKFLNEVISAPFGAGNKVWNPWPNEPLPDPNDTRDYSKLSTTMGGGRKPVDIDSLLKQVGYNDMNFLSQPPAQQKQILDKIIKQFAAQGGIDMNSEWGRTMLQKAAQTSMPHLDVLQNLYYANQQAQKEASMTPQQRMQYASFGSTMAQQQKQIEDYIQKNPNKADRQKDQQFQKELGEYLTTKANLYPEKMTPLERQELRSLALSSPQYRKQAMELYNRNFSSGVLGNGTTQTGTQNKQQITAPAQTGAQNKQQPGFFQTAKASVQGLANSPAVKPLVNIASNPVVRAANTLAPANLVARGVGAYNNLKNNYDVNVGGTAGTSGIGVGGAITPKRTDQNRPSIYGGAGIAPGERGGWLTPTAGTYGGRVQYTRPTSVQQPVPAPIRTRSTQPVAQTTTAPARVASTQAYLPATRSTTQRPTTTSVQQPPRYSKGNVPGAIAFFQRYGRWPSESEL